MQPTRTIRKREINYIEISDIGMQTLKGLCAPADIFYELVKLGMNNNSQKVIITPSIRKKICENCGIKLNTQSKAMKTLIERNLIKRISNGYYFINPVMIAIEDYDTILEYNNLRG